MSLPLDATTIQPPAPGPAPLPASPARAKPGLGLLIDKLVIVEMLTQQGFEYLISSQPWIASLDKLVLLYMLFRLVQARRQLPVRSTLGIVTIGWAVYLASLAFVRHLPPMNLIQIILSGKFIIFYLYYLVKDDQSKSELVRFTLKALLGVIMLSIVLAPLELLLMPDLYSEIFDIQRDGRGFNNTFLTSYFHSRSLFASVLLVPLSILLSTDDSRELFKGSRQNKYAWILAILILIYLSFSRKELAIAMLFIGITLYRKINIRSRSIRLTIIGVLMGIGASFLNAAFMEVNDETLGNEDYIRFALWNYGYQIYDTYFPFGSGPGTYGTQLSRYHFDTYIQFDVPEYIYEGYEDRLAPIYDVYIASLMAEGGLLGCVLTAAIVFQMARRKICQHITGISYASYMTMLSISVLILVIATPVLTNMIGYLFFGFAGMLAQGEQGKPRPGTPASLGGH